LLIIKAVSRGAFRVIAGIDVVSAALKNVVKKQG
jgi:hypothetical protein